MKFGYVVAAITAVAMASCLPAISGETLPGGATASVPGTEIRNVGMPSQDDYFSVYNEIIEPDVANATIYTGLKGKNEAVFRVPYSYRYVLRNEEDIYLFKNKPPSIEKGALGFETLNVLMANEYRRDKPPHRMLCFFPSTPQPYTIKRQTSTYTIPWCLVEVERHEGVSKLGTILVQSNIPVGATQFSYRIDGVVVKTPAVVPDVKIDHEFGLELVFVGAYEDIISYKWRSEGIEVDYGHIVVRNGMGRIPFEGGYMTVKPIHKQPLQVEIGFVSASSTEGPPKPADPSTP